MRTTAYIIRCIFGMLAAGLLSGCIHEFPVLPTETSFTLHLDFDTEMPLYKELEQTKARAIHKAEAYDARHLLSVHRVNSDGSYDRTADTLVVFTCDDVVNLNCSRELVLREGTYKFFVWTDFVQEGSQSDKFYSTADFAEIILNDKKNHTGNCDFRDAFRGERQTTVTVKKDELTEVADEATVTMIRPMAKFKFISTDYDVFVENVLRAELQKAAEHTADEEETESRNVRPEDYRVVFRYTGFMPCSYNLFTDKPADSWTGVSFESELKPLENHEVELGFDYVFVNGVEAGVSVMLEIYHKDGELVASSPSIDVPLKRSRLTIVRGSFLTSTAEGGVGIVPDFDGEYNVEIK